MLSRNKQVSQVSIDLTLSELIDRYAGKNYIYVDYKPNGVVSVWISNDIIEAKSNDEDKTEDDLK